MSRQKPSDSSRSRDDHGDVVDLAQVADLVRDAGGGAASDRSWLAASC